MIPAVPPLRPWAPDAAPATAVEMNPFAAPFVVERAHVLLVELDARLRPRLAGPLVDAGHDVVEAQTSFELLGRLRETDPATGRRRRIDIVLCPATLPGLTAADTLAILRSFSDWPPLVVHTSRTPDGTPAGARPGVVAVFDRPLDVAAVLAETNRLAQRRRGG